MEKAQGVWIEDSDGHRYLDAAGGAVVVNVGQGREEIAKAVYDQILRYHYIHPTVFSTETVELLASVLAGHAPKGLDRYYFLSGVLRLLKLLSKWRVRFISMQGVRGEIDLFQDGNPTTA